jgi:hypothetical protein
VVPSDRITAASGGLIMAAGPSANPAPFQTSRLEGATIVQHGLVEMIVMGAVVYGEGARSAQFTGDARQRHAGRDEMETLARSGARSRDPRSLLQSDRWNLRCSCR